MQEHHESIGRYLSCLYRHTQIFFERELSDYGLGHGTFSFLMILSKNDGIHQEKLSRFLNIDKATTARAIKRLMLLGYVERKQDPKDRRAYRLHLTKKGLSLKPILARTSAKWSEILTAGFDSEERIRVLELLRKMSCNSVNFRESVLHK